MSNDEQEVEEGLESTMDSEGGLVYKMPRPKNINDDDSLNNILRDWFLEEQEEPSDHDEIITNDGDRSSSSCFRYTLSRQGHKAVAEGIRELLNDYSFVARSSKRQNRASNFVTNRNPTPLPTPLSSSSQQQQEQLLYSWGSGDFCRLWYDSGTESLPDPNDYSSGLYPSEIVPGLLHALEVRDRKIGAALNVHNPFNTDRVIYLTYLTTSETAAANKVYPKIKVKMVVAAEKDNNEKTPQHRKLLGATSVILNPSHGTTSRQQHQQYHHLARTSAVGLLPAFGTGTLEFATLEEYTVHPFRIVGVSILPDIDSQYDKSKSAPFEFDMFSPRRLSVDNTVDDYDNDEYTDTDETKP